MPKAKVLTTEKLLEMKAEIDRALKEAEERERAAKAKESVPTRRFTKAQEDQLLEMARASLRQYGSLVPPKDALYSVMRQVCPHCGEEKQVATEFGFKKLRNGRIKPQSWCRACRNGPDSHPTRRGR